MTPLASKFLSLLRSAASIAAASLVLVAAGCGGGDVSAPSEATALRPQGLLIAGVDGAAIEVTEPPRATLRVARDGAGAPSALPNGMQPAGEIYQFTPHGYAEGAIRLRVPFDAARLPVGARPQLLYARAQDRFWSVVNAEVDAGAMLANVPALGFARVAYEVEDARATALGVTAAAAHGVIRNKVWMSLSAAPPFTEHWAGILPLMKEPGTVTATVHYAFRKACLQPVEVTLTAMVVAVDPRPRRARVSRVELGSRQLRGANGSEPFVLPISAANNGLWTLVAEARCRERGRVAAAWMATQAFVVRITEDGALPAIVSQPQDVSVVEGDPATFSAVVSGATSVQWQRSADGAVYADIAHAAASSYTLPSAAVADRGALFRLSARNASGTVYSDPARLEVSERLIAPSVTLDPADQDVLEGETASFTVAGDGKPAPTIQWQMRVDEAAPWDDISGATGATYTTPPLGLGADGQQFRAVLSNGAGSAFSAMARLAVRPAAVAPTVITAPTDAVVQTGECATFWVYAEGTAPLSYRWGHTGGTLESFGEMAVVCTTNLHGGQTYDINVEVTNSAGSAVAGAHLTVNAKGETVPAATGATLVDATTGARIDIPAASLAQDTFVSITGVDGSQAGLPPGVEPLTGFVRISPAGLRFSAPARLTLPSARPLQPGERPVLVGLELLPQEATMTQTARRSSASTSAAASGNAMPRVRRLNHPTATPHLRAYCDRVTVDPATQELQVDILNTDTNVLGVVLLEPGLCDDAVLNVVAHPADTAVPEGSPAVLRAVVRGVAPYTFQWLKDGSEEVAVGITPSAPPIASIEYPISQAGPADLGNYSVVVTNAELAARGFSIVSREAKLSLSRWQLPGLLLGSREDRDVQWHEVGLDAAGNAFAAWTEYDSSQASWLANGMAVGYDAGTRRWSTPPSPLTLRNAAHDLRVDAGGSAWLDAVRYASGSWTGSSLSEGLTFSYTDQVGPPRVGSDGAGRAMAIWTLAGVNAPVRVYVNSSASAGSWGPPRLIYTSPPSTTFIDPQIALDATGNAFVVLRIEDAGHTQLLAARYTQTGGWDQFARLDDNDPEPVKTPFKLVASANGDALVVWRSCPTMPACGAGQIGTLYARRFAIAGIPGSGWQGLVRLGAGTDADAGIDSAGNAMAVWSEYVPQTFNWRPVARRLDAAINTWSMQQTLDIWDFSTWTPRLAMDAGGSATVVWTASMPTVGVGQFAVRARHYMAGSWTDTEQLVVGANVDAPRVGRSGTRAVVLWRQTGGQYGKYAIWAMAYE